ncbi:glycosyltransferase family 4 protein [Vicingus serpentipes]|uniref:Glycosyltransferase family 4 protein n=1 Tax=Vicingus serpentipes TaxID=1926625 RepID=A0A5C6RSA3_9FLAO|nr:glycosyltransferase family 1 protein [Vicingus serpentipes]TXB65188.1 glycosyltransferase family 4 protein [Vicingus serpentipes]
MRIGFDSKRLFCNFTGLGNYSRTLLKNLSQFHPENNYFLYTPKIKETPETSFFLDDNIYKTYTPKSLLKSYWRSFSIVKQLQKDKIELFHGLSNELPFNIKQSGLKSIVTIHDLIFKHYPKTYPAFDRKIYDLKFKASCNNANSIIAISESTKKDIINFYGINAEKIDVVYQSCNPIFYNLQTQEEIEKTIKEYNLPDKYFLFVGSVEERKNLKVIIEAYQFLPENLKLPLVIVGKPRETNNILDLIKTNQLENLVIWKSNLKNNLHLQAFYQRAEVLIYPSLFEGFGLPIVEGLLSKTPVISSNVSSLPEAGGPNTIYINPKNPKEMALAIEKVITNENLKQSMIEKGYQYAIANFSAEVVTKKMIEVYKKTINS